MILRDFYYFAAKFGIILNKVTVLSKIEVFVYVCLCFCTCVLSAVLCLRVAGYKSVRLVSRGTEDAEGQTAKSQWACPGRQSGDTASPQEL